MNIETNNVTPTITVITPSFNQGRFIGETIESVLSQGVSNVEYLVFDAVSTDETVSVLSSYNGKITWVSEPDRGQTDAVNKGLKAARGKIIGWLNSDDIYYPGAFSAVLEVFEQHPEVDVIYGLADHIDEKGNFLEEYYNEEWDYDRLRDICFICQPAVFFRKSVVDQFGPLDDSLNYCMDYEYWLRIGEKKPFFFLKQKLAGSRLYHDNKTLGAAVAVHREILQMFKKVHPPIPDRWIFNYAHVKAGSVGLTAATSKGKPWFLLYIISVSLWNSLKLRGSIPSSMIHQITEWIAGAWRK